MKKSRHFYLISMLVTVLVFITGAAAHTNTGPIHNGTELDYQPAIIRIQPSNELLLIFERITPSTFYGDLYHSTSSDNGVSWSPPLAIINSSASERHPALIQIDSNAFALFYLKDTGSGQYRIYHATSSNGTEWVEQGQLDLGWSTSGEINPNVIRETNGTLTMVYQRLSGASYIAQSSDNGATWDKYKTQVSEGNAALPRIAKRKSDGLYVVVYQVNPGDTNMDMYVKTSDDAYDWSQAPTDFSTAINSHDAQPIVLEDGTFLITYAMAPGPAFDIYYRLSQDGLLWSTATQVTADGTHYDTQPHPLSQGTAGHVLLAWSHQESDTAYVDHDVWVNSDLSIPSGLSNTHMELTPNKVGSGEILTHTLQTDNTSPFTLTALISNTLPPSLTYQSGSLWCTSGACGYQESTQTITWSGQIGTENSFSMTFNSRAPQHIGQNRVITNYATLKYGDTQTVLSASLTFIPTRRVFMPIVTRKI